MAKITEEMSFEIEDLNIKKFDELKEELIDRKSDEPITAEDLEQFCNLLKDLIVQDFKDNMKLIKYLQ